MNQDIHTLIDETATEHTYPLITGEERLAILQDACGIFEGREGEILAELEDIRRGFDRELPSIT